MTNDVEVKTRDEQLFSARLVAAPYLEDSSCTTPCLSVFSTVIREEVKGWRCFDWSWKLILYLGMTSEPLSSLVQVKCSYFSALEIFFTSVICAGSRYLWKQQTCGEFLQLSSQLADDTM